MNLRLKRWITAGATLAMVATMGLSACSTNRALSSETGKNEVTMASRTPNWIFPISAKGYTQGENGQFIQSLYRPLFAYKSTSETPYKINLPKSLWGCAQVVDVLFMRLLSRPLGVVRIRWGLCRRGWCGCGGGCRSLRSRWRPRCRPGRGW